jgi:two-component system, NtrC family, response regulator GlrR
VSSDTPTLPEPARTAELPQSFETEAVDQFSLIVLEGPNAGQSWMSSLDRCSIGSMAANDLVLGDDAVSRFHCEILMSRAGPRIRDLGSRNGTFVDGLRVQDAFPRDGSVIRIGRSAVLMRMVAQHNALPVSSRHELGSLVAVSTAMRSAFAILELAASTDSTVLIEGESGTGKEGAAIAVHEAGRRRGGPFIVVDCGAIPAELLESELFGHEKGAFTGAVATRQGAFEAASGGTIFLDEIGDLPLDMQPKLLRALEHRQIRRVGANGYKPVDVRVIAATNRDLRSLVNTRDFRSDLYYRLAVVRVRLPPLRERPEDVPLIIGRLLENLGAGSEAAARLLSPGNLARIARAAWPGNVRELRNYLERCLVLRETVLPIDAEPGTRDAGPLYDPRISYDESRRQAIGSWERRYLELLLAAHGGKVEQAARASGVARAHLYRLVAKHGLLGKNRR